MSFAQEMYERRSDLGLVGGSIDVHSSNWVSREATTGPGVSCFKGMKLDMQSIVVRSALLLVSTVDLLHASS